MSASPRRIVYAGTPDFAVPALQRLVDVGHEVVGVYTQPDRPAGRGKQLTASPVKQCALDNGLPVYQPLNFKEQSAIDAFAGLEPDLMVVAAYGLILPKSVLDIPRLGCINIHASLLPRWRGAAPIQRAIIAGDPETGITIMQMDAGLDTGDMLLKRTIPIEPAVTGSELHDRLMMLGGDALMEALPGILDGTIEATPQDDASACYAGKLNKAEAEIDWTTSAVEIERRVRAFNAWPVAYTHWRQSEKKTSVLRIWRSEVVAGSADAVPGTVIRSERAGIEVATGDGILRLLEVQMPGKQRTAVSDFVNAYDLTGSVLAQA